MRYLTDEQYDELIDHLQGMCLTQSQGLENIGLKGYKLTPEQRRHRDENIKRCRKCGRWRSATDTCYCS